MADGKTQQVQVTSERLRRLYELALTVAGNPIDVLDKIVTLIAEVFSVRVALVERLEGDNIVTLSMYFDGKILHEGVFDLAGTPCANVREAKSFCSYSSAVERFPHDRFLKDHGLEYYIGLPIISSSDEVIAIINAMNDRPIHVNEEDLLFLQTLASRARLELEREEQATEAEGVRSVLDILHEISQVRDLDEALQLIVDRTRELLNADITAIATMDENSGATSWKAVAGYRTDKFREVKFAPGVGLAARTIMARRTIALEGIGERPGLPKEEFPINVAEEVRNVIGVPLIVGERIVGVLMAGYRSDRTFTEQQIKIAETTATQAAVIIENARLFTEIAIANERLLQMDRLKTEMIAELSTPVIPIWDRVFLVPIIGTLDRSRAEQMTQAILQRITESHADIVILDITGVRIIDTDAAQHLINTVTAVRVIGSDCIITGIRGPVAQTLVHLGIKLEGIQTRRRLSVGLQLALQMLENKERLS